MPFGLVSIRCTDCGKIDVIDEKYHTKRDTYEMAYGIEVINYCDVCREKREKEKKKKS